MPLRQPSGRRGIQLHDVDVSADPAISDRAFHQPAVLGASRLQQSGVDIGTEDRGLLVRRIRGRHLVYDVSGTALAHGVGRAELSLL